MSIAERGKPSPSILIVGASRGLGHAIAAEFLKRNWSVVGTVRDKTTWTPLHDLAERSDGKLEIETVDVSETIQIDAMRTRLANRVFDMLFVNAGTANRDRNETIADISTAEFARVMVTNAMGPMRIIEACQDLVPADGLIGIMSSGQGSVANNDKGGYEIYRASKAALNQCMRSYAARHAGDSRALLLMAPGWIRTRLGGPNAPFSIEETIPDIVATLLTKKGKPGLDYLDRMGKAVAW
ncbi:SDR family oxidoreductase [Rhizobium jaguaris]|uniref:SDR family oxidoreductase n=1 Tax=Rhizobium jaguaris TaxID=1312183 RepID=A0A387G392_9HYPH|nr:SDR family oxidoreductase [Rhizobium jaguaris]AYG62561.1 SDR family oxidoreductase [Rhizobium jaguaris]